MAFEITDELRAAESLNPRLTLGEFRAATRDLPDETPLVTAGMDEYEIADARVGTVRIGPRDDPRGHLRRATGAVYEAVRDGELAVFVDLNDLASYRDGGE